MTEIATTPFGRRSVTFAQIQAQATVKAARERAVRRGSKSNSTGVVNKWALLRTLNEIRPSLGVSDRALGVLSALLSFHPETALTLTPAVQAHENSQLADAHTDLVVFPSNRALCMRANGMAEPTLRRHLAALVEAGLIIRRDSPNGKRYVRRAGEDSIAQAFGFDLSPLIARYPEFEERQERFRREQQQTRLLKERINLLRRDLSKRITYAIDEDLNGPWDDLRQAFLAALTPLRRLHGLKALEGLNGELEALRTEVANTLENAYNFENINGNDVQNERHNTDSTPDSSTDSEPAFNEGGAKVEPNSEMNGKPAAHLPLGLVLDACRDIEDYHFGGGKIANWPTFIRTAAELRPMLGISLDAWKSAVDALGEQKAAVAVAFILQRCEHSSEAQKQVSQADGKVTISINGSPAIRSPGGYLRALTEKGRVGEFPLWPAILAHLSQRLKLQKG
jgi:replication initiation protein RepC